MLHLLFFLVALFCMVPDAHAEEILKRSGSAPKFNLDAPSPRMLRVTLESEHYVEFEREPAISRSNIDRDMKGRAIQRHDALAGTRYRYRARAQAVTGVPAGHWSRWKYIRTPRAPTEPPTTPRMLKAQSDSGYVVSLEWASKDGSADGFLLERCIPDGPCKTAALLNPDVFAFEYHTLKARQFRIAAFNAVGTSPFSARTELVGEDIPIKQSSEQELVPADSRAARLITRRLPEDFGTHSGCTTPERLIQKGYVLVGINGLSDLYMEGPDKCGTGGCIFITFTINDGCYTAGISQSVLSTSAPFFGIDDASPGVVVTNSSGSAYDGAITIYSGTDVFDFYRWRSFETSGDRFPPFGEFGSYQEPDPETWSCCSND